MHNELFSKTEKFTLYLQLRYGDWVIGECKDVSLWLAMDVNS